MSTRRTLLGGAATLALAWPGWRLAGGAELAVETRSVSGFDSVQFDGFGDLFIEQTQREHLSIEGEPAVLARIVTEVRQRRLHIGFAPGQTQTRLPLRFRLEVKALVDLEALGSGDIRIGQLTTPELSLRLRGSGDLRLAQLSARQLRLRSEGSGSVEIGGGSVQSQHVLLSGSGDYGAVRLASREAEVALTGSGDLRLAVAERLVATLTGSGDLSYLGQPRITQAVRGSGEVHRLEGRPPN
jgi:hypothetical protein